MGTYFFNLAKLLSQNMQKLQLELANGTVRLFGPMEIAGTTFLDGTRWVRIEFSLPTQPHYYPMLTPMHLGSPESPLWSEFYAKVRRFAQLG